MFEIGQFVKVAGVDATGGVVACYSGDNKLVNVVFDGGKYGYFEESRVFDLGEPEVTFEAEGVLVIEEAVDFAVRANVLKFLPFFVSHAAPANRRAVIGRHTVEFQRWARIKDYGGQEYKGCDVYRWVNEEVKSIHSF